ncbi:MAG TPA: phosphoribosylamine--glycine ligase [Bacteroidetes bacterium]|nr:phosphoribosylamine--glycine ligase [Bacteroidota bacterium]
MNILVIGSGGREHALCHSIVKSASCDNLFIAPGNAGTAGLGSNVALNPMDFVGVTDFVGQESIGLVVVGPEAPLDAGLADHLRAAGIPVVGPGKAGAILESSKAWSKAFMQRHGIPTAASRTFSEGDLADAVAYVQQHPLPVVVKASGLAAGKGVLICETSAEAEAGVRDMLSGSSFGDAGATIVVEAFLSGIECSVFILTDGESWVTLPNAKDYKRIGEGDTGLNTGGMGAVSPVPFADDDFMALVNDQIVVPTVQGLKMERIPFQGFIFFGLIAVQGAPYVIEYNVRMGDPETEVVFPRITSDVVDLLAGAANGALEGYEIGVMPEACTTVMLVSGGYPGTYAKGLEISGLDAVEDATVFHAGSKLVNDRLETNGGRVLAITAFGSDIKAALEKSLRGAEAVEFSGKYFRRDIGQDLL